MKAKFLVRLILAAVIVSLFTLPTAALAADTIKFGVAGPQSGDLASYGSPSARAARLIIDDYNAKGGVLGKQIELMVEDEQCKPELATNVATKLVSQGVNVVLGHICSGATKAAMGIYKDAKIVAMSPSATNPALTYSGDYPNFYRTIAPDDAQARLDVEFALKDLGFKKIAVLHDKQDYGKGFAEFAQKFLQEAGADVVLFEGITPGAVDYSAVVQKVRRSGAEAVIYGGYHPEASKLVAQMRKKKMDTVFISDDGVKDDTFIKVAGEYSLGVYASGPLDVSKNPQTIEYVKKHQEKYGEDPGAFFENACAATVALLEAIKSAGSTDYDAIRAALTNNYVDTTLGKIKFDKNGDAEGAGFAVYQVQAEGDKLMYVEVK